MPQPESYQADLDFCFPNFWGREFVPELQFGGFLLYRECLRGLAGVIAEANRGLANNKK